VLAAVILSAGESSRMGSPKALVPFRGRTFLEHLVEAIRQASSSSPKSSLTSSAGIGWTRVVLGAHVREISDALKLDDETVIVNPRWKSGQLSSIQAAIEGVARLPTDGLLLFLVDHPLVSGGLVKKLVEIFYETGDSIVLPTYRGKRGHPVIFARRLYAELLAAPQDQGARAVVWAHAAEVLEVPTDEEGVVLNLNDPEALRKALGDDGPDAQG
jgi:molybdenum cofactor cytidylyltransferase